MAWFSFLKSEGYFDPEKNPGPIKVKDGFQIPFWEALGYLEKLSIQINQGNETDLTEELIGVIKNISEQPKDNYRTWYLLIKILSNIPNEKIPIEILDFIPVWLSGKFDTMLQTSELTEKLLPKFLNESPTPEDIEKAELILQYLFQVEKTEVKAGIWVDNGDSYRSRIYLHFLSDKFEKGKLAPKIVKYCSSNLILELGRTIKFLLLDYPKGIHSIVKDGEKEYEIKIYVEKENLLILTKLKGSEIPEVTATIANWEEKNESNLQQELVSILEKQNITYNPNDNNDDTFQRLNFALNTGLTSAFGLNTIRKLDDRFSSNGKVLDVFCLIFRELLDELAKLNPSEASFLLKTFCYDKKYNLPFYKRIALYIICENWEKTKSLFWELVKENDPLYFFSKNNYEKELYDLLQRNQIALEKQEKVTLQNIIDQGEQGDSIEQDKKDEEYWQLRWYSALKDIEPFKEKYLHFSKLLNITNDHFENLGEVKFRSGSVSPISTESILEMSNQEIVEYIEKFKPKDKWEDPSISGLSDTLGAAVEAEPERFASEIELFKNLPYIYTYRMLNSFDEAWKKQKIFDWEKILNYCLSALKNEDFYLGKLKLENDSWNATSEWVVGSIAHLITTGLRDDANSFDIKLLPIAKEIIQIIVSNLKKVDDFKGTNMDYPTYSLNSTAGKSLRALFDYSLFRARNLFKHEDKNKWEQEIKSLFEGTLEKGILDGNVLEGMYFEQFYFLDNDWITEQVKQHYKSQDREWFAFIGGFAFGNPPFNKDLYSIFFPHYERAIENHIGLKGFHNNGLVRHLTAFYFWKYETLSSEKLLFKFLNKGTPDEVGDLINFIWRQEVYQKNLSELQKQEFQQMILELWKYLVDKYEKSTNEEEEKNLASLASWIVFAPELSDEYTKLILQSCKHINKIHSTHQLLENLAELKSKGNPNIIAKFVGEIISSLNFNDYISDNDQSFIKDLVSFLFIHGQGQVAEIFCNKLASVHQQFFLREIYNKYKTI
ncbi:MAG: hypothetical protein IPP81_09570 [Chitinophagaceae bacterium]|nr:hypothetical protein [Chitinophagaceae bacterium]